MLRCPECNHLAYRHGIGGKKPSRATAVLYISGRNSGCQVPGCKCKKEEIA